jgi:hypothetical protein
MTAPPAHRLAGAAASGSSTMCSGSTISGVNRSLFASEMVTRAMLQPGTIGS